RPAAAIRRRRFGRWAVAAAVLVAVGAAGALAGVPWVRHANEVAEHRQRAREAEEARRRLDADQAAQAARAEDRRKAGQSELNQLRDRWAKQSAREVEVSVTGPEDIQAGAPNAYTIEVYKFLQPEPDGQPQAVPPPARFFRDRAKAKLGVQVVNA